MIASIQELSEKAAKGFKGCFFDIDDTFSTHGKILPEAYQALWNLKKTGLKVVPITGRPAGWCDHIARMWPVDGVVGENGAFYFWLDNNSGKLKKRFVDNGEVRREKRRNLETIKNEILSSVPGAGVASDQRYREADLAIDFCEDVEPLGWTEIDKICDIFKKHGATAKVSSIHVNGWFGDYTKLEMTAAFVEELWGIKLEKEKDYFLFCGDSPNDEPMFQYFPYSAGVKNVLGFLDHMKHLPRFVASKEGGKGFAEIVKLLLSLRAI